MQTTHQVLNKSITMLTFNVTTLPYILTLKEEW